MATEAQEVPKNILRFVRFVPILIAIYKHRERLNGIVNMVVVLLLIIMTMCLMMIMVEN